MSMNFIEKFQNIWNADLFMIDKNSVTVQKLVIALFILFFGLLIVRYTTKVLSKKLFRIHFKETTAAVTEKLLY